MQEFLDVVLCQMTSVDNVNQNLFEIQKKINEIKKHLPIDLICFPENVLFFDMDDGDSSYVFDKHDPVFSILGEIARECNAAIHLGSIPWRKNGSVFNTSVLIDTRGSVSAFYNKIHLFDVNLGENKSFCESAYFSHGEKPSVFQYKGWKIGQSICYDLRFSELYSQYAYFGVDLILVPAAFTVGTGKAHWEILLRARAIESQAYVLASAQSGIHVNKGGTRHTYGHSLAIDPWGTILAEIQDAESSFVKVRLLKDNISKVRNKIPMHQHRRFQKIANLENDIDFIELS